jgi:hypothetical protein
LSNRDKRFLDETSERVRQIFHYWDGLRDGRAMPTRRGFNPMDLPRHLPGLLLIDVEGVQDDGDGNTVGIYRYRVVGSEEVANRGHDPTGKLVVDGYFAGSLEDALQSYEIVRRSKSFLYEPMQFVTDDHLTIDEYSILLPFSEDDETVNQILVYSERRKRPYGG